MAQMPLGLSLLGLPWPSRAHATGVHTLLLPSVFGLCRISSVAIGKASTQSSLTSHLSGEKLRVGLIPRIFYLPIDHHLLVGHTRTTSSLIVMILLSLLNLPPHKLLGLLRHIL